jgi:hypothetical protein
MNLEEIEQRCLKYLTEVSNPLVPVETLLRYIQRNDEFLALSEKELLDFLKHHELFRIVEPLPLSEGLTESTDPSDAAFRPKPRVMLATRIPTAQQLKQNMHEEMDRMIGALTGALLEAREEGDPGRIREVQAILKKARHLQSELDKLMQ